MNNKKRLSGMTLIEIIVALAVFAMLSLVLVTIGNAVERHSRAARSLNSRVAVEGPVAEAQNGKEACLVDDAHIVSVGIRQYNKKGETPTNADGSEKLKCPVTMEASYYFVNQETNEDGKYSYTNATDDAGNVLPNTGAVPGDWDFKYISVPKPTGTMAPITEASDED